MIASDRGTKVVVRSAIATLLLILWGCDLSVLNPGPVQDEFLNDPGAHDALVVGSSFTLSNGLAVLAFIGAEAAAEYTQAGRIHPIKLAVRPFQMTRDDITSNEFWIRPQRARWQADDAVRRLREAVPEFSSYALAGRALLYAGYANRLAGENFCGAVIDSGPVEPVVTYFERAEARFSEALAVASQAGDGATATAARAGRASVRVHLGDWTGAASDAALVPSSFVFRARYEATDESQFNMVHHLGAGSPWRAHSVVQTYYEDYYRQTGDPRVSWGTSPSQPTGEFDWVPWLFQRKYTSDGDDINLSSGREMRLIEAEAHLRGSDWESALDLINDLRATVVSDLTSTPIPAWSANGVEETWTHLKRERGIELWLEGRRMSDLRRWIAESAPGEMEDMSGRIRLCLPIPDIERQTNSNIPMDHQDPVNPIFTG